MITVALRRTLVGALLALAALLAAAEPPRAQPAAAAGCPPEVQPPTAQQIEHGVRHHARDRGFLWRLQRDGRTSYLYGTIHLGRFEWAFPGPTVLAALRDAQVLALELDLNDPQTMQRTMALALREAPGLLDDTRAARLARQLDAQCLPQAAVAVMHPVFQVMTLTLLSGRHDGFDPAWAQEAVLTGAAQALQRRVVALETPERQVQALLASDLAGQRYLLDSTLTQLEDGSTRRGLHRLAEVWEHGDLARLADYESWCECVRSETGRQFMRELNDAQPRLGRRHRGAAPRRPDRLRRRRRAAHGRAPGAAAAAGRARLRRRAGRVRPLTPDAGRRPNGAPASPQWSAGEAAARP